MRNTNSNNNMDLDPAHIRDNMGWLSSSPGEVEDRTIAVRRDRRLGRGGSSSSSGGDNSSRGGGRGLSTLSASEKEEFERSQFDEALRASRQDFDRR